MTITSFLSFCTGPKRRKQGRDYLRLVRRHIKRSEGSSFAVRARLIKKVLD